MKVQVRYTPATTPSRRIGRSDSGATSSRFRIMTTKMNRTMMAPA
jgi:hypothetical protein